MTRPARDFSDLTAEQRDRIHEEVWHHYIAVFDSNPHDRRTRQGRAWNDAAYEVARRLVDRIGRES